MPQTSFAGGNYGKLKFPSGDVREADFLMDNLFTWSANKTKTKQESLSVKSQKSACVGEGDTHVAGGGGGGVSQANKFELVHM